MLAWKWRTLSAVALIVAMTVVAGTASGRPADRAAALAAYDAVQSDQRVPAGWTGSEKSCTVGTESAESIAATQRTVNVLRDFAGLQPVSFEASRNAKALAAALMMRAAGKLSHSTGPSWPCYSEDGSAGANTSNLFLGSSGAGAMVGYVDDSGVASLGHRFWLLDPRATIFGTGSTGSSNALLVVDSRPGAPTVPSVAWPPAGWVPAPWVFADWSLEFTAQGLPTDVRDYTRLRYETSNATVSVRVGGVPVGVTLRRLGAARLSWKTTFDPDKVKTDTRVDVSVEGVTVGGIPSPVNYSFTVFPVQQAVSTDRREATIRLRRAPRGGKVTVKFTGVQERERASLKWRAQKPQSKQCRVAAKKVSATVPVVGGKARTRAPRCRGKFSLAASVGGRELRRVSITVR